MSSAEVCEMLSADGGLCDKQKISGYIYCRDHLHVDPEFAKGIKQAVRRQISEQLSIADDSSFKDTDEFGYDLDVDSLDAVELVMEIEELFGIEKIPDDIHKSLNSVEKIAGYLVRTHPGEMKAYLCGEINSNELHPFSKLVRANPKNVRRQINIILNSEIIKRICRDTGLKSSVLEELFVISVRGNFIEHVTPILNTKPVAGVMESQTLQHELFLLTRKSIFHFTFSPSEVNVVRVGLEDAYLCHSENYDKNGNVSVVCIDWNIRSHVRERDTQFEFIEAEGINGARRFMEKYLNFLEEVRDTTCPVMPKN